RIAHAISGAKNRLIFAEIRKRPTETDCRRKVVPVVFVPLLVRIWRVLARKLELRQRTSRCVGIPQRGVVAAGNPEQGGITSDRKCHQAIRFPWNTVIV